MRVLIIDNYDSFTFNLYQYVGEILSQQEAKSDILVIRNDEKSLEEIKAWAPDRIIISPGPGTPEDENYFGVCRDVILQLGPTTPLMGVCLGMQGIAYCFGGTISRAEIPMHGKASSIAHDGAGVFHQLPQGIEVMRYHSLVADQDQLPECLSITSVVVDSDQPGQLDLDQEAAQGAEIMGIRHKEFPIQGIQFHPESFATEGAKELIGNFIFQR